MSSSKVVLALYRSFLRNAKILDKNQCFKAILPPDFYWRAGKQCDVFANNTSCVATVRAGFRAEHAPHQHAKAIDGAIALNKYVAERVQLLYCSADKGKKELLTVALPPWAIMVDHSYEHKKAALSAELAHALDKALERIDVGSAVLCDGGLSRLDTRRLAEVNFQEAIRIFPMAEAHVGLMLIYYRQGELDRAESECVRAMELDPSWGHPCAYLARIRLDQGHDQDAAALFEKAKLAPRYDDRYFASGSLAGLHLSKGRFKLALHEYIQTLHWMPPGGEAWAETRNSVHVLATALA